MLHLPTGCKYLYTKFEVRMPKYYKEKHIVTHGLLYYGTHFDGFLRKNPSNFQTEWSNKCKQIYVFREHISKDYLTTQIINIYIYKTN